jgi:membrane-bound lytic murein transglycosylase B
MRYASRMKANHLLPHLAAASVALVLLAVPARAEWSSCLSGLRHSAASGGVSEATISAATNGLEPNDAVSFMDKQPEFTTPVWDYVSGLVDEERVVEGREMLHKHSSALDAAQPR